MDYRTLKYVPLATASTVLLPLVAKAQSQIGGLEPISPDPTATAEGKLNLSSLVNSIVTILFYLATAAAIIYLIVSGFRYISAGGDQDKADAGRKGVINAVIGIIIVAAAFFIINSLRNIGGSSAVQTGNFTAETQL